MFTVTFIDASEKLAKEVKTLSAMRLYHILPKYLSHHEWKRLNQHMAATELNTTQGVISKALDELRQLGVVEKRGSRPTIVWRLSPDYGWKGDVDSYDQADDRRHVFPRGLRPLPGGKIEPPSPT